VLCGHERSGLYYLVAVTLRCGLTWWFSRPLAHAGQLIILSPATRFDVRTEAGDACRSLPTAITTRREALALPVCTAAAAEAPFSTRPLAREVVTDSVRRCHYIHSEEFPSI